MIISSAAVSEVADGFQRGAYGTTIDLPALPIQGHMPVPKMVVEKAYRNKSRHHTGTTSSLIAQKKALEGGGFRFKCQ